MDPSKMTEPLFPNWQQTYMGETMSRSYQGIPSNFNQDSTPMDGSYYQLPSHDFTSSDFEPRSTEMAQTIPLRHYGSIEQPYIQRQRHRQQFLNFSDFNYGDQFYQNTQQQQQQQQYHHHQQLPKRISQREINTDSNYLSQPEEDEKYRQNYLSPPIRYRPSTSTMTSTPLTNTNRNLDVTSKDESLQPKNENSDFDTSTHLFADRLANKYVKKNHQVNDKRSIPKNIEVKKKDYKTDLASLISYEQRWRLQNKHYNALEPVYIDLSSVVFSMKVKLAQNFTYYGEKADLDKMPQVFGKIVLRPNSCLNIFKIQEIFRFFKHHITYIVEEIKHTLKIGYLILNPHFGLDDDFMKDDLVVNKISWACGFCLVFKDNKDEVMLHFITCKQFKPF